MRKLSIILVLILSILSCERNDDVYEIRDVTYLTNRELFNCGICFSISNISSNGFVIRNEKTYKTYADSMRIHPLNPNVDCDTATLIEIDFSKYTLIGIPTGYGACDTIKRTIMKNEKEYAITYNIDIKEHTGFCIYIFILDLNLALIPKISDNYKVVYVVNRHT